MLNFPTPYPNELIYSTIARAGIHHAITSPKQLLEEVFAVSSVVLPENVFVAFATVFSGVEASLVFFLAGDLFIRIIIAAIIITVNHFV